ncbi:MAG TPA: DHA2 family efflux MFS transporter permease subunit [Jatrophihabitans sp.]|jgi:EmrB/QacA subfamily drug resistance transporter|uniref:DHA2 family efflux MFS transporter permease subunit n=1 Tax=Jatrophihabitans sp. TaxID=1932789 RepID=UPI002EE8961E
MTAPDAPGGLVLKSAAGRWALLATVLGSGMAALDATVVNVALPRIGADLDAGLTSLQWTLNGYTLTLSGLLLLGGSLGDRLGRRRIFSLGVLWFAIASAGCAAAPNVQLLIGMRALQGVAAALLMPGSLAILEAVFRREDRAAAVGAWSGLGGIATAIGPVVGGLLVGMAPWGWRLVFLLNLPLAAVVMAVAAKWVPETRDEQAGGRLDLPGAGFAAVGLGALIYALTEGPVRRWPASLVVTGAAGVLLLVAFAVNEHRRPDPMMPLSLFRSRQFSAANLVTFLVYAALSGAFFLLPVQLQLVSGFTPVAAGSSLLPVTVVMLLLSARMGRLAQRIGPRWPMTFGPVLAGIGLAMLVRVGAGSGYLTAVLPAVLVFALGLTATVAPLTATVLAAAPERQVGVASAVNNAVARTAGLLAVAVLPALAGLTPAALDHPAALSAGFHHAVLITAALCIAGGLLAGATISDRVLAGADDPGAVASAGSHPAAEPPPPSPVEPVDPVERARRAKAE